MRYKNGNVLVSIAAFFIIFFVFCAFAIDFSLMLSARSQLQNAVEVSALKSITSASSVPTAEVQKIFAYYKAGQIKEAKITNIVYDISTNPPSMQIEASVPIPTYFLSVLGVGIIEVQAKAKARVSPVGLTVGDGTAGINLPFLLFDKDSDEIFVEEAAPANGYYVFIGLQDGTNATHWVNISCTGTPVEVGEFIEDTYGYGGYYKGSATFDIGHQCDSSHYQGNSKIATDLWVIPVNTTINSIKLLNVAKLVAN